MTPITKIGTLKTIEAFQAHVAALGLDLHADNEVATGEASPLRQSLPFGHRTIGNRIAIHPMEGWDGTTTGAVTEPMIRRWQRFGESGAKLIWGGEAMAVRPDGRANPNQIIIQEQNAAGIARLREALYAAHLERYGKTDDLICGFQLTHSGRFCRPQQKTRWESRIAYRHPLLDRKFNVTSDAQILTDLELGDLTEAYVKAARLAQEIGADFVDIKHCHGYLLHEFLSAHTRPGRYGGSFENRTRLFREIVAGIRAEAPQIAIGVRLSAFDLVPFKPGPVQADGKAGLGMPEDFSAHLPYRFAFGVNADNPLEPDLSETREFLELVAGLDVKLINLSAGSPYYNPHIQRPAIYPPSDGYQPHEDPLISVARQIRVVGELKTAFPQLTFVGSGYSYLQEYLPHVAQYYVKHGQVDVIGLGRMVLSYPSFLTDAVSGAKMEPRLICRTFSDCTTAPRNGLPSGCYPLDDYYKRMPEAAKLKTLKKGQAQPEAPLAAAS